jgi:hypothetical protein
MAAGKRRTAARIAGDVKRKKTMADKKKAGLDAAEKDGSKAPKDSKTMKTPDPRGIYPQRSPTTRMNEIAALQNTLPNLPATYPTPLRNLESPRPRPLPQNPRTYTKLKNVSKIVAATDMTKTYPMACTST